MSPPFYFLHGREELMMQRIVQKRIISAGEQNP
jgi:hypothetical protein